MRTTTRSETPGTFCGLVPFRDCSTSCRSRAVGYQGSPVVVSSRVSAPSGAIHDCDVRGALR